MNEYLKRKGALIIDQISHRTGIVCTRDILKHPHSKDVVTLDIPGYRQTNSYACGYVAGLMVLHAFYPGYSDDEFYYMVNPKPQWGTSTTKLIRALRKAKIGVSYKTKTTFLDLKNAIDAGYPVIVCVETKDKEVDHWVVVYGYGTNPNRVFVAANSLPYIGKREYTWELFASKFYKRDRESLTCWGK